MRTLWLIDLVVVSLMVLYVVFVGGTALIIEWSLRRKKRNQEGATK